MCFNFSEIFEVRRQKFLNKFCEHTHTHKRGTSFAFFTRWKTGWVQARKLERQFIYKKLLLKFKINRLGCYANLVYLVK